MSPFLFFCPRVQKIERLTGKRVHEMFDMVRETRTSVSFFVVGSIFAAQICGTSTGGLLALGLGVAKLTVEVRGNIVRLLLFALFVWSAVRHDQQHLDIKRCFYCVMRRI